MIKSEFSIEAEKYLIRKLLIDKRFYHDPEAFILYVFPWGEKGTPLEKFPNGPRKWQRRFLREIKNHLDRESLSEALGSIAKMLKKAVASGRGIGKSALVAWIVIWFMTTRIGGSVIISANNEDQLRLITWAEIEKWVTLAMHGHWFEVVGIKMTPVKWLADLVAKDLKIGTKKWFAEGKLWSKERPDSYAGDHSQIGMLVIFDEASGIPDGIWTVAEGFFTEPILDRFMFAFSNPRINSGTFYSIFNDENQSEFWEKIQIDARTVEGTDPQIYEGIIKKYGPDSMEARVEVYGMFPITGDEILFNPLMVENATRRSRFNDMDMPVIMGIDPAGQGKDSTGVAVRRGRDLLYLRKLAIHDPNDLEDELWNIVEDWDPDELVFDKNGLGYGLWGNFKRRRKGVKGVNGANNSSNSILWYNVRAELWGRMKDWISEAHIPNDNDFKQQLISQQKKLRPDGALQLLSKIDAKKLGISSPDLGDAVSLTFAVKDVRMGSNRKLLKRREPEDPIILALGGGGGLQSNWMGN